MVKRWFSYRLIVILLMIIPACFRDDAVTPEEQLKIDLNLVDKVQLAKDLNIIDAYLESDSIEFIKNDYGVRYVIHEYGTGITPELADFIKVNYMGALLGETEPFDSRTETFELNSLILGWRIGFRLLQVGDSATFYVPSGLGYGELGNGVIPPNANLTFSVRLLDVERF